METCDPIGTPNGEQRTSLTGSNGSASRCIKYRSMIGALNVSTISRPDIVHATCLCARYQAQPTEKHLKETATVETVNDGEQQITVTIDGHKFAIIEQLSLMGPKKTSWEQFSRNIATAIICLATNRTFKFSQLIFDGVHVPLFDTMLLHDQSGQGKGPTLSVESQHTPTASSSSTTSQATSSQTPSSHEPTTEPITTTSSPHPQET
ncbi:hypothetical protein Tco_0221087 [Tanacetum coccineum]